MRTFIAIALALGFSTMSAVAEQGPQTGTPIADYISEANLRVGQIVTVEEACSAYFTAEAIHMEAVAEQSAAETAFEGSQTAYNMAAAAYERMPTYSALSDRKEALREMRRAIVERRDATRNAKLAAEHGLTTAQHDVAEANTLLAMTGALLYAYGGECPSENSEASAVITIDDLGPARQKVAGQ